MGGTGQPLLLGLGGGGQGQGDNSMTNTNQGSSSSGGQQSGISGNSGNSFRGIKNETNDPLLNSYTNVLCAVRELLVMRMVKPPEVTIKENEEGHIVRQENEDTDELALYKIMRETLIFLTHLNPDNMDRIMTQ